MTPSMLCAWLRSLGWRRVPDLLSPWDSYQRSGEIVEVPMLREAGSAMDWPVEWTIAHFMYGAWRNSPEMSR